MFALGSHSFAAFSFAAASLANLTGTTPPTPATAPQITGGTIGAWGWSGDRRFPRDDELAALYRQLRGEPELPAEVAASVAEAVRPFAQPSDTKLPPPEAIDFAALAQMAAAVEAIIAAMRAFELARRQDDEDALAVILAVI